MARGCRQLCAAQHRVTVLLALVAVAFCVVKVFPRLLRTVLPPEAGPWKPEPRRWKDDPGTPFNSMLVSVMTYNVLSDALMRTSMDEFKYCEPEFLNLTSRRHRILLEIEKFSPDIICMQEMDGESFPKFWEPRMYDLGYTGTVAVTQEENQHNLGQAIFRKMVAYGLRDDDVHLFHDLAKPFIEASVKGKEGEDLSSWFRRRNLIQLASYMEVISGKRIAVGCTQFSQRQDIEPAVQVLQASLGIQALELFARRSGSSMVVLAGDLASPPASPAYQFIARGELSKEVLHKLKEQSKRSSRFAKYVTHLIPDAFKVNLTLKSAYRSVMGSEPRLTSLHAGSTSSYVWFSTSGLGVAGVLVEPEVTSSLGYWRRACSPHFPSSHIPVMAQFYIKPS